MSKRSINKCNFIGNLGSDPEVRYSANGTAVANFSIACTEQWKGGEEKTEWVRCVAFSKLAEICGQYLKKGQQVYVEGRQQTRSYDDKDGNKRYTTEVVLNEMLMLGGKSQEPAKPAKQEPVQDGFDDIPF